MSKIKKLKYLASKPFTPLVQFFKELTDATRGRRNAVLAVCVLFLGAMVGIKSIFNQINQKYTIGADLSVISSNDHVFFIVKRKLLTYSAVKVGDYIHFVPVHVHKNMPQGITLIKQVVGKQGDHVQVIGNEVRINGVTKAKLNPISMHNLNITQASLQRDFIIGANELYVLGAYTRSFDSRYWGVLHIPENHAIDLAEPVLF